MDLVLRLADDYILDKAWACLVPISAFAETVDSTLLSSASSLNASHPLLSASSSSGSTWSHLVSHLPHPPLSGELLLYPAVSDIPLVSAWPRDYIPRQLISLTAFTLVGIHVLYFLFAWLSFRYIFNHEMMKHPKFLKNQIKREIMCSLKAFPGMTLLTIPWFLGEVRGYSKMYENVDEYGWGYFFFSIFLYARSPIIGSISLTNRSLFSFLAFTDYGIYWIHRWEHHPLWYKWLHKPHHVWRSTSHSLCVHMARCTDHSYDSPYPLRVACFPCAGRIPPVDSVPSLPIHLPAPSEALSGTVRLCKLLEHFCEYHLRSKCRLVPDMSCRFTILT